VTTDWIRTLKEAGILARETRAAMLKLFESDVLSVDQAERLLDAISELSDEFDDTLAQLYENDSTDEELLAAAEAIEDLWSELCYLCIEKVRALRQHPPIKLN